MQEFSRGTDDNMFLPPWGSPAPPPQFGQPPMSASNSWHTRNDQSGTRQPKARRQPRGKAVPELDPAPLLEPPFIPPTPSFSRRYSSGLMPLPYNTSHPHTGQAGPGYNPALSSRGGTWMGPSPPHGLEAGRGRVGSYRNRGQNAQRISVKKRRHHRAQRQNWHGVQQSRRRRVEDGWNAGRHHSDFAREVDGLEPNSYHNRIDRTRAYRYGTDTLRTGFAETRTDNNSTHGFQTGLDGVGSGGRDLYFTGSEMRMTPVATHTTGRDMAGWRTGSYDRSSTRARRK